MIFFCIPLLWIAFDSSYGIQKVSVGCAVVPVWYFIGAFQAKSLGCSSTIVMLPANSVILREMRNSLSYRLLRLVGFECGRSCEIIGTEWASQRLWIKTWNNRWPDWYGKIWPNYSVLKLWCNSKNKLLECIFSIEQTRLLMSWHKKTHASPCMS